jgi:hypothetical protein
MDIKLDYLKDTEGNYILKNVDNNSLDYLKDSNSFLKNSGEYTENLIISRESFEKKLKHKLEDIVQEIENSMMLVQKIKYEDILSEKITLKIKPEEEFNPLFKIMSDSEIAEYTKSSKKVRVEIHYEFDIKTKPHLVFGGIINSFKKTEKGN